MKSVKMRRSQQAHHVLIPRALKPHKSRTAHSKLLLVQLGRQAWTTKLSCCMSHMTHTYGRANGMAPLPCLRSHCTEWPAECTTGCREGRLELGTPGCEQYYDQREKSHEFAAKTLAANPSLGSFPPRSRSSCRSRSRGTTSPITSLSLTCLLSLYSSGSCSDDSRASSMPKYTCTPEAQIRLDVNYSSTYSASAQGSLSRASPCPCAASREE